MTLTRRSFLKAIGASAMTMPFVSMLERSVFGAEVDGTARRFVGLYHPHGASSPLFLGPDGATDFDLTFADSVLSPFDDAATYGRSFKDVVTPIHGLDVTAIGGHDAPQALLTGSTGENASLDQFLAVEQGLGAATPITSVVLSVGDSSTNKGDCISFGAGGVALPKVFDPRQTFDLLFANLIVGDDPEAQARLERARLRGKSVLDFVRGDIGRLQPRLATTERHKLDQHLTSLREIEKRLDATAGGGAMCVKPQTPRAFDKLKRYNGGEPNFEEITNLQIDLLAQAMACDITRFATIMFNDLSAGGAEPAGLAELPENNHQDLAHRYDGPRDTNYGGGGSEGDRASWLELGKLNRWHYGKCARLLQRLDEGGVLEDSLVWMSSDMGDPAGHSSRNVPTLLAGGAGGAFQMGRRVVLPQDCPPDRYYCQDKNLVPNNHLLVSVARAFGVEIDSFGTGDADVTTGHVSQLLEA